MTGMILKNNLFLPVRVFDTLFSPRFLRQRSGAFCSCPLSPHFWVGKKVQTFPVCLLCTRSHPQQHLRLGWSLWIGVPNRCLLFILRSSQSLWCGPPGTCIFKARYHSEELEFVQSHPMWPFFRPSCMSPNKKGANERDRNMSCKMIGGLKDDLIRKMRTASDRLTGKLCPLLTFPSITIVNYVSWC